MHYARCTIPNSKVPEYNKPWKHIEIINNCENQAADCTKKISASDEQTFSGNLLLYKWDFTIKTTIEGYMKGTLK